MKNMEDKLFFCYELDHQGWCPVAYHDYKPTKNENALRVERTPFWEVPDSCLDEDGNPMFGKLKEMFPWQ